MRINSYKSGPIFNKDRDTPTKYDQRKGIQISIRSR